MTATATMRNGNAAKPIHAGPPGTWKWIEVTPDLAELWLGKMANNRRLRSNRVAKLVNAMNADRFRVTHQGVAFNMKGELVDGQHRLQAIVASGKPQWMWVYEGLTREAVLVIDTHATRSVADGCTLVGVPTTPREVAAIRRMWSSVYAVFNRDHMDPDEVLHFRRRHATALQFAFDNLGGSAHSKGINSAPVVAAVARAWYSVDRERLAEFCRVLVTGIVESPTRDGSAIRLRDLLLSPIGSSTGEKYRRELYCKSQTAIQAFLEGRQLKRLDASSRELFPIKGDVSALFG